MERGTYKYEKERIMKTQKVVWEMEVDNIRKSTCGRFYIRVCVNPTTHPYKLFYANNVLIALKTNLLAAEKIANKTAATLVLHENI